jgi:hypothetical protein
MLKMGMEPALCREGDETFWQRLILPEEERRCQPYPPQWNGSYRWFRSANIIDLWRYRSPADKKRIIDHIWRRRLTTKVLAITA